MKKDVAIVVSDTQKSPRGPLYQSAPPQYHHYLPIQDTQYFIVPPQYVVYNAQQYAFPPNYPQWRASTYQNVHPSSQNFRAPYNLRPTQGFEGGQRPRNNFTPIRESYTRHSIENCHNFKKNVEEMIQTKMIVVQNDDPPNVTKNHLPAHIDVM
ncbi:hypothetical protein R3W88_001608 [Solanum pinnatisectum]|uniref:Uncharacterized protein n=1 Tax=Solanum pinnatisectum TaxID=50273 RepID=A0AAV9MJG6_9SOLN|nr:hypothetical protein R3W88_001608 [Solanum pinnatisectum]